MHPQVANRFCVAITKVERWHRAPATHPMPLPPTSTTVPPAEISRVAPVAVSTTVTGPPSAVRNTANRPASANWTTPSGARGSEASYSATSLEPSTKLAVAPSEYASSRGPLRPAPCRTPSRAAPAGGLQRHCRPAPAGATAYARARTLDYSSIFSASSAESRPSPRRHQVRFDSGVFR